MSAHITRKKMGVAEMATPARVAACFYLVTFRTITLVFGVVPVTLVVVTWML